MLYKVVQDRQPDGTDGVSLTDQTLITVSQGVNTSIQHSFLGTLHRRHPVPLCHLVPTGSWEPLPDVLGGAVT